MACKELFIIFDLHPQSSLISALQEEGIKKPKVNSELECGCISLLTDRCGERHLSTAFWAYTCMPGPSSYDISFVGTKDTFLANHWIKIDEPWGGGWWKRF